MYYQIYHTYTYYFHNYGNATKLSSRTCIRELVVICKTVLSRNRKETYVHAMSMQNKLYDGLHATAKTIITKLYSTFLVRFDKIKIAHDVTDATQ